MEDIIIRAYDREAHRMSKPFHFTDDLILWDDGDTPMPLKFAWVKTQLRGRMKFMLWTGRRDKSNKRLFEQDIIEVIGSLNQKIVSEVTFDHQGICIEVDGEKIVLDLICNEVSGRTFIIKGTVFSNKELITL